MTAWDPDLGTPAMRTIVLAKYVYDDAGRLRAVWDPRLDYVDGGTKHLWDRYSYDADGILNQITPVAEEPWNWSFTTLPGDSGKGRIAAVSRSALAAGTAITTVVYRVPTSGTGAPYDLSPGQTARWNQVEAPTDAAAVFGPDQVPNGNQGGGTLPTSYERAALTYMDANGREVNSIEPGAHVSTTWFDSYGNVVRSLTPTNRARALDANAGDTTGVEAALANTLSTLNVYTGDGRRLERTFGPEHAVSLPDGSVVRGRAFTRYTYDQGAPAGGPYDLVTTQEDLVRWWTAGGTQTDSDPRVTTTAYDWTLRLPTAITADSGGLAHTTRTTYDPVTSLPTSTTMPAGGVTTNTPRTRQVVYYTTAANGTYPECGGRAEWANLTCRVQSGGQSASGPAIPVAVVTYDLFHQARTLTEKTGGALRTTTITYDTAARPLQSSVTGAAGTGEPLPTVKTVYEAATGRAVRTQTLNGGGSVTAEVIRAYDSLGRQTAYTDADGITSTTGYDLLSRPSSTGDGKGTQTMAYDGGPERRGLLTGVSDTQVGSFTATHDPDGTATSQTLPNGIVALTTINETGSPVALQYRPAGCSADSCAVFSETVVESVHGQWATRSSTLSDQGYTYDKLGRLTAVADTVAGACTTRVYGFDTATNRTTLTTYGPATGGDCQTTTPVGSRSWTYDTADRVSTTGYTYDTLGRTTALPAADIQTPAGGNLTAAYHVTDLVRSLTEGGGPPPTPSTCIKNASDPSPTNPPPADRSPPRPTTTTPTVTARPGPTKEPAPGSDPLPASTGAYQSHAPAPGLRPCIWRASTATSSPTLPPTTRRTLDSKSPLTPANTASPETRPQLAHVATLGSAPTNARPTPPPASPSWAFASTTPPPAASSAPTLSMQVQPTTTTTAPPTPSTVLTSMVGRRSLTEEEEVQEQEEPGPLEEK